VRDPHRPGSSADATEDSAVTRRTPWRDPFRSVLATASLNLQTRCGAIVDDVHARGDRPNGFDLIDCSAHNAVERGLNTVKPWRGLAGRYDEPRSPCRGGAILNSITL
jgi:hypothetical protein